MSLPYHNLNDQDTRSLLIIIADKLCCLANSTLPQYTTAERDALTDVPEGKLIYNTTTNKANIYTGSWEEITSA